MIFQERFRGEIRSLIRCKGVGVRTPTLYHVDQEKSVFVMEFIEGMTCRDYIRANREDEAKLTVLASEIGRLIGVLHTNNLIHGDLTTSNVLVEDTNDSSLQVWSLSAFFVTLHN